MSLCCRFLLRLLEVVHLVLQRADPPVYIQEHDKATNQHKVCWFAVCISVHFGANIHSKELYVLDCVFCIVPLSFQLFSLLPLFLLLGLLFLSCFLALTFGYFLHVQGTFNHKRAAFLATKALNICWRLLFVEGKLLFRIINIHREYRLLLRLDIATNE